MVTGARASVPKLSHASPGASVAGKGMAQSRAISDAKIRGTQMLCISRLNGCW